MSFLTEEEALDELLEKIYVSRLHGAESWDQHFQHGIGLLFEVIGLVHTAPVNFASNVMLRPALFLISNVSWHPDVHPMRREIADEASKLLTRIGPLIHI